MKCPRCDSALQPRGEERWRCSRCRGTAVRTVQLIRELRKAAPDLVPPDDDPPILTDARRSTEPRLACPACSERMEPVLFAHVDLDRCYEDHLVWFDDTEHEAVLDVAKREQAHRVRGLLRALFDD
ncbi:MAG: zf-TFIIB domain-containing protein [Kofleriaceae bacterium]